MYIQNFDTLYVISDLHMGERQAFRSSIRVTGFESSSDPSLANQAGSAWSSTATLSISWPKDRRAIWTPTAPS
jgi:hypothetical protein